MAVNLLKQEEVQRLEKEKMKKLTLEINERQEEEDLNEAIAMVNFRYRISSISMRNAHILMFSKSSRWTYYTREYTILPSICN